MLVLVLVIVIAYRKIRRRGGADYDYEHRFAEHISSAGLPKMDEHDKEGKNHKTFQT